MTDAPVAELWAQIRKRRKGLGFTLFPGELAIVLSAYEADQQEIERLRALTATLRDTMNSEVRKHQARADEYASATKAAEARVRELVETLRWYAEQTEGCRKLGSIGDPFRHALDADGGDRARAALSPKEGQK